MINLRTADDFAQFALNHDDCDMIDIANILLESPNIDIYLEYCEMTEICPIHTIALEICIDDESPDCDFLH